ncbi:hypothetical protein [Acuticoccus kandeliae]|uniref:hypothetical protein n=1 Tax=Acuticoccus kandeliae TaxID=2073160 RepID=UPI000D3EC7BA|nr:hypothetical protein [Acuticoccus kandeliae]
MSDAPADPDTPEAVPARLHADRVEDRVLHGWAHGPAGTPLTLRLDDDPVATWRRAIDRPDVDEAVGDTSGPKGFTFPVAPLGGFLALLPEGRRPAATLGFGEARLAIDPAPPARTMATLGAVFVDMWLADSRHIRMRTGGAPARIILLQYDGRVFRAEAAAPPREAIVTLGLADPTAPILLLVETDPGPVIDLIPFPTLLRGGAHAAETLATVGGDAGLPARASTLAARLARRTAPRLIAPEPGWETSHLLADSAMAGFIAAHTTTVPGAADEPPLPLGEDEIPTIAALCGEASGLIVTDPAPGGETWMLGPILPDAVRAVLPEGCPPPPAGHALEAPAVIRARAVRDEGLDPLLFPLPSDAPYPDPLRFRLAVLPGVHTPEPLLESLAGLPFETVERGPFGSLADDPRPVLFADPAIVFHDRRTVAALTRIAVADGVATAAAMIIGEPAEGQITAHDRVRAAGLFPTYAAVDAPWRPAVGPIKVSRFLPRTAYAVAANDPACVMVAADVFPLAPDLSPDEPDALPRLMAHASRVGGAHIATTWFSVFDRGSAVRPTVAPAFHAADATPVSTARRLI